MTKSNLRDYPIIEKIEKTTESVAAFLTIFAAVIIFLGVILRNIFKTSPSWISELPTYAFTWAVFLALMSAFSSGPQLGLDAIVRMFSARWQRVTYLLISTFFSSKSNTKKSLKETLFEMN